MNTIEIPFVDDYPLLPTDHVDVQFGRELGFYRCDYLPSTYYGHNPWYTATDVAGTWEEWVEFAKWVLATEERRQQQLRGGQNESVEACPLCKDGCHSP